MRLILTDDNGTVLDTIALTREELAEEQARDINGALAQLATGPTTT